MRMTYADLTGKIEEALGCKAEKAREFIRLLEGMGLVKDVDGYMLPGKLFDAKLWAVRTSSGIMLVRAQEREDVVKFWEGMFGCQGSYVIAEAEEDDIALVGRMGGKVQVVGKEGR